jgi:hypothetical protein
MALTVTNVFDNPWQPGVVAFDYLPDQLIAGPMQRVTQNVLVMSGNLARGTVLGRQTNFSIQSAAGASNTGNGTIGTITQGATALVGTYTLTATSATNWTVTDPEGNSLPAATTGTAYSNTNGLGFTLTAGGTAFAAGDTFTLAVSATTGNFIACVKTASDGSQTPVAILADSANASSAPVMVGAYFTGEFNANAVTIDTSWTIPDIMASLQGRNIHLKSAVIAADPVNA